MKLLTSQIAGIAAAACALVASPVRAAPSGQVPLPIGLHANAQYEAGGRPLVLRFAKPARVITGLHCRIAQGDDGDDDEPADDMKNPQPACVFRSIRTGGRADRVPSTCGTGCTYARRCSS